MMFDMIMIGDWGEEIDDETATYFLNGYYNDSAKTIAYVCVGGKMSSQVRKYKLQKLIPDVKHNVFTIEEFVKELMYKPTKNTFGKIINKVSTILQTAPIEDNLIDDVKIIVDYAEPYEYILQGELGKTMNSKDGFTKAAEYFIQNATQSTCVTSPYPHYTYNNSLMFGQRLSDEIMKTSFKFMVGRAEPSHFTVHLLGDNGANFKLTKSIYESMTSKSIYDIQPSQKNITIAKDYCSEVNFKHPFAITKMKDFSESVPIYENNLARMLECYENIFGITDLMYSKDIDFESPQYQDSQLCYTFNKFKSEMQKHPDVKLTPAYDLKAAYIAVEKNGYDDISVDEIMITCHNKVKRIIDILVVFYLITFFVLSVIYF